MDRQGRLTEVTVIRAGTYMAVDGYSVYPVPDGHPDARYRLGADMTLVNGTLAMVGTEPVTRNGPPYIRADPPVFTSGR